MSPAERLHRADEALDAHRANCGCRNGCEEASRLKEECDRAWQTYVDSLRTGGVR